MGRTGPFLMGVLLGAAVTGAAWLLLEPAGGSDAAAPVRAAGSSSPSSTVPASVRREVQAQQPPPPTAEIVSPERARMESPSAASEASATLATRRGEGWVDGFVRDREGHPVAGVSIVLTPARIVPSLPEPDLKDDGSDDESLEEAIRRFAAQWRRSRAERRTAVSDAEGRFRIEGLPEGNYRLQAQKPGWRIHGPSLMKSGDTADLEAVRLVEVPLDVRLPDGRAPSYAVVVLFHSTEGGRATAEQRMGWSPQQASLWTEPGRFEVRAEIPPEAEARAGVSGEWASPKVAVVASLTAPSQRVRLDLAPRLGIRGRVSPKHNALPEDVSSLTIVSVPLAPGQQAEDRLAQGFGGDTEMAHRWYGFHFEFLDLTPGRYALFVKNGWNGPILGKTVVEVQDGVERVEIPITESAPGPSVIASVHGPDGEPVTDATFHLTVRQPNRSNGATPHVTPLDEPGRYRVALTEEAAEALQSSTSSVWLSCESASLGAVEHEVHAVDETLVFGFAEPGTLVVHVLGYERPEVAGRLRVDVRPVGTPSYHSYSLGEGRPGSDGTVRKTGLQPGRYIVSLQRNKGDDYWSEERIAEKTVDIGPGVQRVELAVPELHTLTVLAPDLDDGDTLTLKAVGDLRTKQAVVENGRATFESLPAGSYLLMQQQGMDLQIQRVTVPAAGPVTLTPQPVNAMRIIVREPDGVYARAGFRDGDLVVAVDGEEFEGAAGLARVFLRGGARKESVFTVLRGGRRIDVHASFKELQSAEDGTMEPWAH